MPSGEGRSGVKGKEGRKTVQSRIPVSLTAICYYHTTAPMEVQVVLHHTPVWKGDPFSARIALQTGRPIQGKVTSRLTCPFLSSLQSPRRHTKNAKPQQPREMALLARSFSVVLGREKMRKGVFLGHPCPCHSFHK